MEIVISLILLFIGIGVLVLIHACVVTRTIRRGFFDHSINVAERGSSLGSTSMSREDIEKLPCFNFQGKETKATAAGAGGCSPAADCAVCLENFRAGEKCRLLPLCNHSFHKECVDLWLLRTPVCPICRAEAGGLFGEEDVMGIGGSQTGNTEDSSGFPGRQTGN